MFDFRKFDENKLIDMKISAKTELNFASTHDASDEKIESLERDIEEITAELERRRNMK